MNKALGLIETIGLVSAIEAADAAVKAANVTLLGYENTKGGGKITIKLVGDVGAVKAGVAAGVAAAERIGKVYSHLVIARPHAEIDALIQQVDRARAKETPVPVESHTAEPTPDAVAAPLPEVVNVPFVTPEPLEAPVVVPAGVVELPQRCAAITAAGEPCKLMARPGSEYCNVHRKLEAVAASDR